MELAFGKYQGAGNDFIICDDRTGGILEQLDRANIAGLCDRRFGIGADGLMLLRSAPTPFDFEMTYYNSDGNRGSMCGNGGRCLVRYAADLGIKRRSYRFMAVDGPHEATTLKNGNVSLGITDVDEIRYSGADLVLDTGSPHYVRFVKNLARVDVSVEGRSIRRSPEFLKSGINVNFVQEKKGKLLIGTYERGVEDETLACGTGVVAAAIAYLHKSDEFKDGDFLVNVTAKGGELSVSGRCRGGHYSRLQLMGPAERVFSGIITI